MSNFAVKSNKTTRARLLWNFETVIAQRIMNEKIALTNSLDDNVFDEKRTSLSKVIQNRTDAEKYGSRTVVLQMPPQECKSKSISNTEEPKHAEVRYQRATLRLREQVSPEACGEGVHL